MKDKKCRCGADIAFVQMASGKKMPVDEKAEQMVWIDQEGSGHMMKVYRPHWGTCPLAKQFKKKKKGD